MMKIKNTTNSNISPTTVVEIENSLLSINGDNNSEKIITTQSYYSSLYKWVRNDISNYFKNKIFPHYDANNFQWGWLSFDVIRSTVAYYPKFLKQLLLNSHAPLAQTINIYLLPVKSFLELTGRIIPWQSKKIIVVVAAATAIIDLAENVYLNFETHDFSNNNNIYTEIDYDFEQFSSAVNFIYSVMDIVKSFGYFNGYIGNKINFSLKFGYQLISIGNAISLITNPALQFNLIPIISNAASIGVCFGNFIIDEFKTFEQGFTCANMLNNTLSKRYAINHAIVSDVEEQVNAESEKEIINICVSNQENQVDENNEEIFYDALSDFSEQNNFSLENETKKKQSIINFKKEVNSEKISLLKDQKPNYGTFKIENINNLKKFDTVCTTSVKNMKNTTIT